MEGEEAVHAAREKLKEKMGNTQIGGKGMYSHSYSCSRNPKKKEEACESTKCE